MLYWLADLSSTLSIFNVLPLFDGADGGLDDHGAGCSCSCSAPGSSIICASAGQGPADPPDGPKSHLITKTGTPTMGA